METPQISIDPNQIVESQDDVVVTITSNIPQPDIIQTTTRTVKEIKNRLASIEEDLINLNAEKASLESLLSSVDNDVKKMILITPA